LNLTDCSMGFADDFATIISAASTTKSAKETL
jgi:hypothetical protein